MSLGSHFNGGGAFGNATFSRGGGFGSNRGFGWNRGFGGFGWDHGFGWRGGCWGCGFGWGFGWGFGLGWGLGWGWGWNPWWWGPGWGYDPWFWDWPPYGYYPEYDPSYNYNGAFEAPYNGDYAPGPAPAPAPDNSSPYGPYSDNGDTNAEPGTPLAVGSEDTNPVTGNVAISAPTVLVYLKDGTMIVANDYWLDSGEFHYTVKYGGENQIGLDQVDVQKSIDENAKRGVKFVLKPRPAMASTTPGAAPKPSAKPATLPPPPALTVPSVVHAMPAAA
jgi:hypothetical protein